MLRKTKKTYYENLDERKVSDKPSLCEKFNARDRTRLSENGEIMKTEKETTEVFNNFFGNIVKNLKIFQYSDFDPIIESVKKPNLKAILNPYRPNPGQSEKIKLNFYFHFSLWCLKRFYKGLTGLHKTF